MANAKIKMVMDRKDATISFDEEETTKVFIRDSVVNVEVVGFTSEEFATVPYLQLCKDRAVLAECSLSKKDGTEDTCVGTISTNTKQMVKMFAGCGANVCKDVTVKIFSTESANPIALGMMMVWNFPGEGADIPSELPCASTVLANIMQVLLAHIQNMQNPHHTTAEQIGALKVADAALQYVKIATYNNLVNRVDGVSTQVSSALSSIASMTAAMVQKANKSEVYTKSEVNQIVRDLPRPLHGLAFALNKAGDVWDGLEAVIKILGGTVGGLDIPDANNAPIRSFIIGDDGTIRQLLSVDDGTGTQVPVVEQ